MFARWRKKLVVLGAAVLLAALLPAGPAFAAGGNCDSIVASADKHDAGWKNWDSLIGRAQSAGCEYSDIEVTIEASADPMTFGGSYTIYVLIKNVGTATANGVTVSAELSPRFDLTPGSFDLGTVTSGSCFMSGISNTAGCQDVDGIEPGTQVTLTMTVTPDLTGEATSTVTVDGVGSGDLDPRNNSDSMTQSISE